MTRTLKQICVLSFALFACSGSALAADGDDPPPGPEQPSDVPALPHTVIATGDGVYWLHSGSVSAKAVIQGITLTINTYVEVPDEPTPHAVRVDIKCFSWQEGNLTTGGSFISNGEVTYSCPPEYPIARAEMSLLAN